jgi:hypothetical protein
MDSKPVTPSGRRSISLRIDAVMVNKQSSPGAALQVNKPHQR